MVFFSIVSALGQVRSSLGRKIRDRVMRMGGKANATVVFLLDVYSSCRLEPQTGAFGLFLGGTRI